jgi:hypothetical protein
MLHTSIDEIVRRIDSKDINERSPKSKTNCQELLKTQGKKDIKPDTLGQWKIELLHGVGPDRKE